MREWFPSHLSQLCIWRFHFVQQKGFPFSPHPLPAEPFCLFLVSGSGFVVAWANYLRAENFFPYATVLHSETSCCEWTPRFPFFGFPRHYMPSLRLCGLNRTSFVIRREYGATPTPGSLVSAKVDTYIVDHCTPLFSFYVLLPKFGSEEKTSHNCKELSLCLFNPTPLPYNP